jgi:arsenite methyltransferase
MNTNDEIKKVVKEKYGEIAEVNSSCCGPTSCCGTNNKVIDYSIMQDDYTELDGYVAEADLGLGCGLPTEYAGIKEGDTVIDLGSGAGNDVFVAKAIVGDSGKVIGIDMTEQMINKANENNNKLGYKNVEFRLGEIEDMPIQNDTADVVVSNCVLNLVPDKHKAFAEVYRVIKPGGHFCVSDIVIKGELPEGLKKSAEMYAGCVAGAVQQDEYLEIISKTGFDNIEIKKSKVIDLPDDILSEYLTEDGLKAFKENVEGIFSITVVGYKR